MVCLLTPSSAAIQASEASSDILPASIQASQTSNDILPVPLIDHDAQFFPFCPQSQHCFDEVAFALNPVDPGRSDNDVAIAALA